MGTKFVFYGEFRLVLCSKWVPRLMGNIRGQGVGVRVGGSGDHGGSCPRLRLYVKFRPFTCHHVPALAVASNLTYGNPYFPPPMQWL